MGLSLSLGLWRFFPLLAGSVSSLVKWANSLPFRSPEC